MNETSSPWLLTWPGRRHAPLDLVCFPFAGGSAQVYRGWAKKLPVRNVHGVQLPGRSSRLDDALCRSVDAVVTEVACAVRAHVREPFALFGHSMGAILAFETARRLHRQGGTPVRLFASGAAAPSMHEPDAPPAHTLGRSDFVDRLREYDGTPESVFEQTELLELLLPAIRADFEIIETYTFDPATPPVPCPITAFGGREDDRTDEASLKAWARHTASTFDVSWFPGGHFFLDTHEEALLKTLSSALRR